LAVTNHLALNDDGAAVGLITRKDHQFVNLLAALTVVLLAAGWVYGALAYPEKIPLQVNRFEPPPLPETPRFAQAQAIKATYDPSQESLVLSVRVTNVGESPVTLDRFTTSMLTFATHTAGESKEVPRLVVEPEETIAPQETRTLKLTMRDHEWAEQRLIPIGESHMVVAGVLTFKDTEGQQNRVTVETSLHPTKF
jgi:methane/ammonia monooxygenase subunit B